MLCFVIKVKYTAMLTPKPITCIAIMAQITEKLALYGNWRTETRGVSFLIVEDEKNNPFIRVTRGLK